MATMNSSTESSVTGETKEGVKVLQWEKEEFPSIGKSGIFNSSELAAKISSKFKNTFHELAGAQIVNNNGILSVQLYFTANAEEVPDGKIKSLDSNTVKLASGNIPRNAFEGMQSIETRMSGVLYTLNDDTKELLAPFMPKKNNGKINWNEHVKQHTQTINVGFYNNRTIVYMIVNNLNLNKLCAELFGKRAVVSTYENDKHEIINKMGKVQYQCTCKRFNPNGTFKIGIDQIDVDAVQKEMAKEMQPVTLGNGLVFY